MKVIIASRMSSSRLPGKALKIMNKDKSMLDILVHRIKSAHLVSGIILATSDHQSDDPLEEWAYKNKISIFRGSLDDVLGRLYSCINKFQIENFVEILGDNPLVDPNDIDLCIKEFHSGLYDYVATSTTEYEYSNHEKSYPVGVRVQCLKSQLIINANAENKDEYSREHSSSFIYKKSKRYKTKLIHYPHERSNNIERLNLAVNTHDDFQRAARIFESLGVNVTLNDALRFIEHSNRK